MNTKLRQRLPVILIFLIIIGACLGGWLWYDSHVDRSGWVEKDGIRYYRDFHGDRVSGWLELEDGRYHFHSDGTPMLGRQDIDGSTYYFGENGIMHTGWLEQDGTPYYFSSNGTLAVGWLELEDGRYYFSSQGTPLLGWQVIDGITYYFGDDGVMHTGWLEKDGKLHYFGGNGTMVVGWLWLEEGRYYLRDGALLTGWQEIDGGLYHFSEKGLADLGWAEIDGATYYFDEGIMVTGFTELDGNTYFFREDGTLYTGWLEQDLGLSYFREDGAMACGWTDVDGRQLYFGENGLLFRSRWLQDGEYRYYFHENGNYAVGPTVIDGYTHYFSPKGIEVVLVNGLNPVPQWYSLDPVNVVDYHDVDRLCYDALNRMLEDLSAAGIEYTFNSAYRTILEQTTILEYRTREHMAKFKLEFQEARDKAYETVAIPGTSEHHLGLAVDLLGDEAVAWLTEHCWDYGFIVRYTEEKEWITGIVDEPWHFRYVGTRVSQDLKNSGLCLEEYLGAEPVDMEKIKELYGEELYQETVWKDPKANGATETKSK